MQGSRPRVRGDWRALPPIVFYQVKPSMSNAALESIECLERNHTLDNALPSDSTQARAQASRKRKRYEADSAGPTEWEQFAIEVRQRFTSEDVSLTKYIRKINPLSHNLFLFLKSSFPDPHCLLPALILEVMQELSLARDSL